MWPRGAISTHDVEKTLIGPVMDLELNLIIPHFSQKQAFSAPKPPKKRILLPYFDKSVRIGVIEKISYS